MRALLITDLHGSRKAIEFLKKDHTKYEVIFCAGDLTNFGRPKDYVNYLAETITNDFFWVSGNNDIGQGYQYKRSNLKNIDGAIFYYKSIKIAGLGGSSENYESQNFGPSLDFKSDLSDSILISHIPPSRKLNYQFKDIDCSVDNLTFSGKIKSAPKVHICGHLHSKVGVACIGRTKIIKVGAAKDGDYAELNLENLGVTFKNFLPDMRNINLEI
jgi:Icc-related predicted phosphoesterase